MLLERRVVEHPAADDARGSRRGPGRCPRAARARRGRPPRCGTSPGGRRAATTAISHGVAGAQRRLLEDRPTPWPGQHLRRLGGSAARSSTAASSSAREVVDLEEVAVASCQRLRERARRRRSISSSVIEQRRGQPQRGGRDGVDDEPPSSSSRSATTLASWPVELDGEEEARGPAPRPRRRAPRAPSVSRAPAARGPGGHVLGLHHGEHGAGRGGGQRLAAVGRGVVARLEGGGHLGLGPAGADGHAVAERLGHRDDVGHDAEVLVARTTRRVRPRPVCTSSTMNRMPRSSQSRRTPWKYSAVGRVHAALALHGLEQHRGDRRVERAPRARRGRPRRRGGSPRAAAGTPRAWPAGRWRGAWRACGRGTSRRRSPRRAGPGRRTCRASLSAHSLASAPELAEEDLAPRARGGQPGWPTPSRRSSVRPPASPARCRTGSTRAAACGPARRARRPPPGGCGRGSVTARPDEEVEVLACRRASQTQRALAPHELQRAAAP